MNSLVLFLIPAYQHNLVSDLVTATMWGLFIQVHWGSWGKSLWSRAQPAPFPPPFHSAVTLPSCRVNTPADWMINGQAHGAIDNLWLLYTKAMLVTLAPV